MSQHTTPSFAIAASLAGRLYRAHRTAREMSISAANAKGVAARAGMAAAGFRPITEFIAEMAGGTIASVQRINRVALEVSRRSVAEQRDRIAAERLARALQARQDGGRRDPRLQDRLDELRQSAEGHRAAQRAVIGELVELLEDIDQRMRGATIIVTQSRTEASHAGGYAPALNAIAASVDAAARDIQAEVRASRALLHDLTHQLRESHEEHRAA